MVPLGGGGGVLVGNLKKVPQFRELTIQVVQPLEEALGNLQKMGSVSFCICRKMAPVRSFAVAVPPRPALESRALRREPGAKSIVLV